MNIERRLLYTPIFHIDTNLINARGNLDAMNQIEKWAHDEVILVHMSNVSFKEAQQGNNQTRTQKALSHIFTLISEPLDQNNPTYNLVSQTLFEGSPKGQYQINDIKIICDAIKWNAILITNDGGSKKQPSGILGNVHKLKDYVKIMRDYEAVDFIREKIYERDSRNEKISQITGQPLPLWHGTD